jgi:hypothetical protein
MRKEKKTYFFLLVCKDLYQMSNLILVMVALLIFVYLYSFATCGNEHFKVIERLLHELESSFDQIKDVSEEDLEKLKDKIIMVAHRDSGSDKEGYSFVRNYWPYNYYTYPYESEVAWPNNLYSRLYNYQPSFPVSGYTYALRPGLNYERMPRGRWSRNNNSYYYINNVY